MAVSTWQQRNLILGRILDLWARTGRVWTINKPDLRAAVDATDQWQDDNTAAFNAAIPQPARGVLSAQQKTDLFNITAKVRTGE